MSELETVANVVRRNLPPGYREETYGKITAWVVPLSIYPDTYNKKALWYAAIVEQKNYISLHLVMAYMNPPLKERLESGFKKAGKKLKMGMGCLNFTKADDLALDAIADAVGSIPMAKYIEIAKQAREKRPKKKTVKKVKRVKRKAS